MKVLIVVLSCCYLIIYGIFRANAGITTSTRPPYTTLYPGQFELVDYVEDVTEGTSTRMFGENGTIKVCMVSLANLCRSPIAAAVFHHVAKEKGLDHIWKFDSAAVGPWYLGCNVDFRGVRMLEKHGIFISNETKTKQLRPDVYHNYDYILAMDRNNYKVLVDRVPENYHGIIEMFTKYDPLGADGVIEPFYDEMGDYGRFEDVYNISLRTAYNFFDIKQDNPFNPESLQRERDW